MKSKFFDQVYQSTKKIPKGKVATYGQIARVLGNPRAARAVGQALNKNPYAPVVPCHRVVASNGHLRGFAQGLRAKERILKGEGVEVVDEKVNLVKYQWRR